MPTIRLFQETGLPQVWDSFGRSELRSWKEDETINIGQSPAVAR